MVHGGDNLLAETDIEKNIEHFGVISSVFGYPTVSVTDQEPASVQGSVSQPTVGATGQDEAQTLAGTQREPKGKEGTIPVPYQKLESAADDNERADPDGTLGQPRTEEHAGEGGDKGHAQKKRKRNKRGKKKQVATSEEPPPYTSSENAPPYSAATADVLAEPVEIGSSDVLGNAFVRPDSDRISLLDIWNRAAAADVLAESVKTSSSDLSADAHGGPDPDRITLLDAWNRAAATKTTFDDDDASQSSAESFETDRVVVGPISDYLWRKSMEKLNLKREALDRERTLQEVQKFLLDEAKQKASLREADAERRRAQIEKQKKMNVGVGEPAWKKKKKPVKRMTAVSGAAAPTSPPKPMKLPHTYVDCVWHYANAETLGFATAVEAESTDVFIAALDDIVLRSHYKKRVWLNILNAERLAATQLVLRRESRKIREKANTGLPPGSAGSYAECNDYMTRLAHQREMAIGLMGLHMARHMSTDKRLYLNICADDKLGAKFFHGKFFNFNGGNRRSSV